MHVFIPVIVFLLIPSAVEMSQATTGEFRRCFEWSNASKVRVSCKKENDTNDLTQIAQYCNDSTQSCRKMNKSGVSLEKDQDICLTITNDSYDLCVCEAQGVFDDHDVKKEHFTVDFNNQSTNTSRSAGVTDASFSQETDENSLRQILTNTSTSPGPTDASPSSDKGIIAGVVIGLFLVVIIIGLCIYKKVKSSRKKTGDLNGTDQRDFEMEERGEIVAKPDNRVRFENEVMGENGETLENGDLEEIEALKENGETVAQNGRQGSRKNVNR